MGRVMRGAAGMMVGAFVMTGAGCTDEPTQPTDLPDTTASAATGGATPGGPSSHGSVEEQAIVQAYTGFFKTLLTLGAADADEIRAELAPYGAGVVIDRVVSAVANLQAQGQEPAGEVVFGPMDIDIAGGNATVVECRDATTELILDSSTKQVVATGEAGSVATSELQRQSDDTWRLTDYNIESNSC